MIGACRAACLHLHLPPQQLSNAIGIFGEPPPATPNALASDRCQNDACPHPPTTNYGGAVAAAELQKCARCKVRTYCSRACQAADWKSHKPWCKPPVPLPPLLYNPNASLRDPTNPHHHIEAFRQAFALFPDLRQQVTAYYNENTRQRGRGFVLHKIKDIATLAAATNLLLRQPILIGLFFPVAEGVPPVQMRRFTEAEEYRRLMGYGYFQKCQTKEDRELWAMGSWAIDLANEGDSVMVLSIDLEGGKMAYKACALLSLARHSLY